MANRNPIDLSRVAALKRIGGEELVRRLFAILLSEAPRRIAQARIGLGENDWGAVERAAHSLKSSAGNIGAIRLQALAERLERLPRTRRREAPSLLSGLETAWLVVREWLTVGPARARRAVGKPRRAHPPARTRVRG